MRRKEQAPTVREAYVELCERGFACGHPVPTFDEVFPGSGRCGYARTEEGGFVCLPCATERERADLLTANRFTAYLTCETEPCVDASRWSVTSWTGAHLMRITSIWRTRCHIWDGPRRRWFFRALDIHGQVWHGEGEGAGTYCRLRKSKRASK